MGQICSCFFNFFFDFLSFEGIFGTAGTLDPPSLNRVKSYCLLLKQMVNRLVTLYEELATY